MPFGSLFSAVVKPDKPLLYICDESTHITNIAISPPASLQKDAKPLAPFVAVLKLQYEGPVMEGEDEEEGATRKAKKAAETKKSAAGDDSEEESEDLDFDGVDIEAKEVVIGCFTPNTLQLTTDIYLAPNDQYRFVLSGGADYEIHLLGRYIPDDQDESPYGYDDDDDSDEEMDDFDLDQLSSDDDASEGGRLEELEDEPVKAKPNGVSKVVEKTAKPTSGKIAEKATQPKQDKMAEKAAQPKQDKTAEKAAQPKQDKSANKRTLEDNDADPDVSMADSTVSGAEGGVKLSKSQRKKLKKTKSLEAAGLAAPAAVAPAAAAQPPKTAEQEKASPAAKPAAPSTVTLPSGLKITDVKVGQGAAAKPGQKVAMRYIGKLTNGKVFDSNTKGAPFNFVLGKGQVIKGWDEGIQGMKLGGERKLIVPANLAYGKNGAPPDIPPNSTLMFEVKLLSAK